MDGGAAPDGSGHGALGTLSWMGSVRLAIVLSSALVFALPLAARADFGSETQTREVREALLLTWTAFGKDPDVISKAVTVSDVTIADGYALCTFRAGTYGGQMLMQSQRGLWVKLYQTGGVLSSVDLKGLVPAETARTLAEHNEETLANNRYLLGRIPGGEYPPRLR